MGNSRFYELRNIEKKDVKAIEEFCTVDPSMDELMDDAVDTVDDELVNISVWFNINEKNPPKGFEENFLNFMRENEIVGELWETEEYGGTESLIFSL